MKNIKISGFILLGSVLLLAGSCKKDFYTSVNNNPNAPSSVTPGTLLSTVEGSLGYSQGGDMSRFASLFTQQTNGVSRQALAYYQYIVTEQDVENLWDNMYTSVMENDDSLMVSADDKGYNEYSGIARVIMAYSLQISVDCWGKMPYSQAFQGVNKLQPAYDNDKDIYTAILALCDSGIAKLSNSDAGIVTPGTDDVIYGGDETKWIKFAHAIKARIYMHQSKGNAAMATSALGEIAQSFTDNTDNAVYTFTSLETFANPWYQFNEQRADISFVTGTMITNMITNNDPRTYLLVDTTSGALIPNDALGAYYGAINAGVEFITYDELQFMTAEATITSGGSPATAQAAYQAGITADMQKLGVSTSDAATYISANGTLPSGSSDAIAKIAGEEYIDLYLNPEAWVLWRRTNAPSLTPLQSNGVPRRLLYPQTEYSYNKANTPSATLYSPKVFWDN